jgi:hypothetical protein
MPIESNNSGSGNVRVVVRVRGFLPRGLFAQDFKSIMFLFALTEDT